MQRLALCWLEVETEKLDGKRLIEISLYNVDRDKMTEKRKRKMKELEAAVNTKKQNPT